MTPDYTPAPCRSIMSGGIFVGTPSDRATVQRKAEEARRDIPEPLPVKRESPIGALRYDQPKRTSPRPAVEPKERIRKAVPPSEPKGEREPRKDRREVPPGTEFNNWTVIEEVTPYIDKRGKKYRYFSCRCKCGGIGKVKLNDLANGRRTSCACQGGKVADIVARRMAGDRPMAIAAHLKCSYERIRSILVRAAETNPDLAALIERERDPRGRKLASRDECHRQHAMSGDNLILRKSGKRECRKCVKIRETRQAEKRKGQRKERRHPKTVRVDEK